MIWSFLRPLVWCEHRYGNGGGVGHGDSGNGYGDSGYGYGNGDSYGRHNGYGNSYGWGDGDGHTDDGDGFGCGPYDDND